MACWIRHKHGSADILVNGEPDHPIFHMSRLGDEVIAELTELGC